MNTPIITIMLLVSLGIGLVGLVVFLWGLRNGQFDDAHKITHGALFDSIEDLNLANAIAQNQQATPNPKHKESKMEHYTIAVIGAGPGGISASVEATLKGLSVILLEKGAEHNATLRKFYKDGKRVDRDYKGDKVELVGAIDFSDTNKEGALAMFDSLLEKHAINVAYNNDVESIQRQANGSLLIRTSGNHSISADYAIITIGKMGQPNKPSYKIPPAILRQVNYNASSIQAGERLLIVGGGNSAVEYAIDLCASHDTTLNYRRTEFARINDTNKQELEKVIASGTLKTKLGVDIESLEEQGGKICAHFSDGSSDVFDRAIYAIGGSSPVDFLKKCNIELDSNNLPIVNEHLQTSVQGVFIAGDIGFKSGASVAMAIAQAEKIVSHIAGHK
ncbi:cbb3-type cytochrome oxidase assembly protein CcoS [Helicobacter zhangjianzhongii]|uniref:Cbb3-type cytochrome oxidase assembly protein CcoS n=1 Tax=Helicobacter zhangjianzhongii TaxID=2974574 RepID=A0ACC6FQF1_9HELI|nr:MULTISPECIES: cbb3-type cytochrome oxidase assembly protein CcoS [unclassified Helicobacter]MDL0079683.1 cbb3-type cytochrome oxidase assembly protein CcoS [Helicobacter sp. CPD2-1]MDL0081420.1 cbb3-type cytochrome oxidase assembly protein CcoS [Helicobacter sp. XJK30-2]